MMHPLLVSLGYHSKIPRMAWLKRYTFPHSSGCKKSNQSAIRWFLVTLSSWLANGHHTVSLNGLYFVCRERERERERERFDVFHLPIRISVLSYYSSILMTSFNLNCILKGPVSKYSPLGVRVLTYKFWG